jgi:hypothetical protein
LFKSGKQNKLARIKSILLVSALIANAGCGGITSEHTQEDSPSGGADNSVCPSGTANPDMCTQAVLLADQNEPSLYFGDGRTVTLTWDLSSTAVTPASQRFPGSFSIDVAVNYQMVNGISVAVGYTFSNPQLQILTGTEEADLGGVMVFINDKKAAGIENLIDATAIARGIDPVQVYNGSVQSPLSVVSSVDKIGIGFPMFTLQPRTDHPPVPPVPTMSSNVTETNQSTIGITIGNDSTARRWCLTASPAVPTSTAAPCPGFENNAQTNGWQTSRPTSFSLAQAGAVTSGQTVHFYLWVANSDLVISPQAAVAQVVFDNTAPASPALGSISVTTTQIADLIGLGDSNEPVKWCTKVSSVANNVQNSQGCQFSSTKPSFVGLTGGGTNFVSIFVKDVAGNVSKATSSSAVNPYGMITFFQLTDPGSGARAVILNSCNSCHGSAAGGAQSFWDSTSYADTVAKKSAILSEITGGGNPMPPANLMDAKSQALIQLWFSQTSVPVQQ